MSVDNLNIFCKSRLVAGATGAMAMPPLYYFGGCGALIFIRMYLCLEGILSEQDHTQIHEQIKLFFAIDFELELAKLYQVLFVILAYFDQWVRIME